MRTPNRRGAQAAIGAVLVALASCACSLDEQTGPITIDLSMEVCQHQTCFTTPVPGATVEVSGPDGEHTYTSGDDGTLTIASPVAGTYTATAAWAGLSAGPGEVTISDGESASLSMGFSDIAKVEAP